jgi:hypothetical protein
VGVDDGAVSFDIPRRTAVLLPSGDQEGRRMAICARESSPAETAEFVILLRRSRIAEAACLEAGLDPRAEALAAQMEKRRWARTLLAPLGLEASPVIEIGGPTWLTAPAAARRQGCEVLFVPRRSTPTGSAEARAAAAFGIDLRVSGPTRRRTSVRAVAESGAMAPLIPTLSQRSR